MARKKSEFLRSFGTAFEVWKAIVDAVLANGGSDNDLRSLIGDENRLTSIAKIVVGERSESTIPVTAERSHGKDEYSVPVTYAALPSFVYLEKEFGKGGVSSIFDGRAFQKHASCANIDETPGDKIFLIKHFNRVMRSEEAIAEMDKQGYRPATHIEAYEFQKAHPELRRQFWIVALGSFAGGVVHRRVAVLGGGSGRRILDDGWFVNEWLSSRRFLFVRKPA